jgi:hypothetical protein
MDYDRTAQIYKDIGQEKRFRETPDYNYNRYMKEQKWFESAKSKRSGDFFQAEFLIEKGMVPPTWKAPHVDKDSGKALTYPLKYVNQIHRIRAADGTEWLRSAQEMRWKCCEPKLEL